MSPSEVLFKDYFAILEISPFASITVVQAAYRALARIYHPDLRSVYPENSKTMTEINEAYAVLSDPVKREGYWEFFLQEYIKKEQVRGKHFYFYKNWEESLRKREQELNDRKKADTQNLDDQLEVKQYIEEYLNSSGAKLISILKKIKKLSVSEQEEFLQKLIVSPYLTLEMEKELLYWILKEEKQNVVPFISKAFKYKDLFPLLFGYISKYQIPDYWDKMLLIAKQLNVELENHLYLALSLLQVDFPEDKQSELFYFAKQEWLPVSFWKKRKKTKTYKEYHKQLKLLLKQTT